MYKRRQSIVKQSNFEEPESESPQTPHIVVQNAEDSSTSTEKTSTLSRQRAQPSLVPPSGGTACNDDSVQKKNPTRIRNDASGSSIDSGFGTHGRNSKTEEEESLMSSTCESSQSSPILCQQILTEENRPHFLQVHTSHDTETMSDSNSSVGSPMYVTAPSSVDGNSPGPFNESPILGRMLLCEKSGQVQLNTPSGSNEREEAVADGHGKDGSCISKALSLDQRFGSELGKPKLKRQRKRSKTEPCVSDLVKLAGLKLEQERKQLSIEYEEVIKKTVKSNAVSFRDYTDFKPLHAHLIEENLVHASESEFLNSESKTHVEKANKFYFETMDRKGPSAYRCLYYALKAEKQHKGHEELVKVLEREMQARLC